MMRKGYWLILAVISLSAQAQTKTERAGEPDVYNVESADPAMNSAIEKSKTTFKDFLEVFKQRKRSHSSYSVKMGFKTTDGGVEHIWLVEIASKNGALSGLVGNAPANVTTVKEGDRVEIDRERVSDWFYIDDGRLIGGWTIRVLRDRMTPSERQEFDQGFGVIID